MRIVSLLPSATEIVLALGLADSLDDLLVEVVGPAFDEWPQRVQHLGDGLMELDLASVACEHTLEDS